MYWTPKELYQIAYIVSRGWAYNDHGLIQGWVKKGHIREANIHARYEDRESEQERELFRLDAAYWEAYTSDESESDKNPESNTIPSPPNPEIGLMDTLEELCSRYDKGSDIPHKIFVLIAEYIGHKGYYNLRKEER